MLTPEQARQALDLKPTHQSLFGFWSYILAPYYRARGGKVLHFWMRDTKDGKHYSPFYTSVCGRDSKRHHLPTSDFYSMYNMPRCKRCLAVLGLCAAYETR
jgi:hypothetical protein